VRLEAHVDAEAFLARAGDLLAADEPRHNLIYAICSTLIASPSAYPEAYFWTVENGEPAGALLRTPPFNIAVAQPREESALEFAARALHAEGVKLPGVGGARPESDLFAAAWQRVTGATHRVRMAHGVYAARTALVPEGVTGGMREAEEADRALLLEWMLAFQDEALPEDAPNIDLERALDRRLASETDGFALWEVDAQPVSMCGYGGPTPHGIRIGPVYTPPDLRRHGYASALTAHATKRLLDGGRDYCFLYTDLANPTSNKIYMDVGYELVCEAADYAFD
jgi:predicted GNAT family acetyltransferase